MVVVVVLENHCYKATVRVATYTGHRRPQVKRKKLRWVAVRSPGGGGYSTAGFWPKRSATTQLYFLTWKTPP